MIGEAVVTQIYTTKGPSLAGRFLFMLAVGLLLSSCGGKKEIKPPALAPGEARLGVHGGQI